MKTLFVTLTLIVSSPAFAGYQCQGSGGSLQVQAASPGENSQLGEFVVTWEKNGITQTFAGKKIPSRIQADIFSLDGAGRVLSIAWPAIAIPKPCFQRWCPNAADFGKAPGLSATLQLLDGSAHGFSCHEILE